MTREQAKEFMWVENHKNPSVVKWQHHKTIRELVENLIDQIFNDHEAQLKLASDVYSTDKMHMYQELKAKDDEIRRLKKLVNDFNNTYSVGDFDFESYYAMLKDN